MASTPIGYHLEGELSSQQRDELDSSILIPPIVSIRSQKPHVYVDRGITDRIRLYGDTTK